MTGLCSEVREVLETYLFCLDSSDFESLADCFTDDAALTYDIVPYRFVGGRALAAWVAAAHELHRSHTFHVLGTVHVSATAPTASARSHVIATLATPVDSGHSVTVRGVRYDDELVETPDGWKICRRTHVPLWQYQATGHALSDIGKLLPMAQ